MLGTAPRSGCEVRTPPHRSHQKLPKIKGFFLIYCKIHAIENCFTLSQQHYFHWKVAIWSFDFELQLQVFQRVLSFTDSTRSYGCYEVVVCYRSCGILHGVFMILKVDTTFISFKNAQAHLLQCSNCSNIISMGIMALHSEESLFPNIRGLPLLLFIWLKWARYLAVAGLNLLAPNIW